MWPSIFQQGVLIGCNLILLDEHAYLIILTIQTFWFHLHIDLETCLTIINFLCCQTNHVCFCRGRYMKCLWIYINKGDMHKKSNFFTMETSEKFKPVQSILHILFSSSTIVYRVLENDWMILRHKFEFVQLQDISWNAHNYIDESYVITIIIFFNIHFIQNSYQTLH